MPTKVKKPAKKPSKKPVKSMKPAAKKSGKPLGASVNQKVLLHLGQKKITFEVVPHKKVFTAYDLAQTVGEKLENIAKTLLLEVELPEMKKTGRKNFVVVVPASYRINLEKVKKALKASKVGIASEKAMAKLGIQPGALTPFGSLRGLGVIIDKNLVKAQKVLVGAESFTESLRVKVKDLVKAEEAIVGMIGDKSKIKLQIIPGKKVKKQKKQRVAKGKPAGKAKKPAKKPIAKKRK